MSEELFKRYKIKAKKALWQNFLVNEDIIDEIAFWLENEGKNIIEVWPWYWALTQKLLTQNLKSLTLVELDKRMVEILEDRITLWELEASNTDFTIENTDILKYIPDFLSPLGGDKVNWFKKSRESTLGYAWKAEGAKFSVIANIPYYITSPILRHFLYNLEQSPEEMVILMQKDVGDKILSKKSSVISLMMAKKCYVSELLTVWKEYFIPAPNVESSVLLFETHNNFIYTDDQVFLKYIKIGFSSARKKLIKNFVSAWLDKNKILDIFGKINIDDNIRGEAIWIEKWCELVGELRKC